MIVVNVPPRGMVSVFIHLLLPIHIRTSHPLINYAASFPTLTDLLKKTILISLLIFIILVAMCLIGILIRQIVIFRYRAIPMHEHNNVEYVLLEDMDDDDQNRRN